MLVATCKINIRIKTWNLQELFIVLNDNQNPAMSSLKFLKNILSSILLKYQYNWPDSCKKSGNKFPDHPRFYWPNDLALLTQTDVTNNTKTSMVV